MVKLQTLKLSIGDKLIFDCILKAEEVKHIVNNIIEEIKTLI